MNKKNDFFDCTTIWHSIFIEIKPVSEWFCSIKWHQNCKMASKYISWKEPASLISVGVGGGGGCLRWVSLYYASNGK